MTVLPPQSKLHMLCSGHAFTTAFNNAAISAWILETVLPVAREFHSTHPEFTSLGDRIESIDMLLHILYAVAHEVPVKELAELGYIGQARLEKALQRLQKVNTSQDMQPPLVQTIDGKITFTAEGQLLFDDFVQPITVQLIQALMRKQAIC